jgi:archaemetzincin
VTARVCILDASRRRPAETDGLLERVGESLGVPVRRLLRSFDFDRAWDGSRGQHDAGELVSQVAAHAGGSHEKFIGVVEEDLFVPVLTFVFGQAQLGGNSAIVSTHRLHNEFYGLRADAGRLRDRLVKEIVHEVGHQFGLVHCRDWECVMRSSTYVEEIDLKRETFCETCAAALRESVGRTPAGTEAPGRPGGS